MKKTNSIMAAIMAAATILTAAPAYSYGIAILFDEKQVEGYTRVERGRFECLEPFFAYYNNESADTHFYPGSEIYISDSDTHIIVKIAGGISYSFSLNGGATAEDVEKLIGSLELHSDHALKWYDGYGVLSFYTTSDISTSEVKGSAKALENSGLINGFKAQFTPAYVSDNFRNELIIDDYLDFYTFDADKAEAYLIENGIGFNKEYKDRDPLREDISDELNHAVCFVPEKEMSQSEKLRLFDEICNTLTFEDDPDTIYSRGRYTWGSLHTPSAGGQTIDISGYTNGDANCDDKVTVADAVAVLQYIANKEKYPLSEQAQFNADIDGEDGITGGDAIVIQKIDAGIM